MKLILIDDNGMEYHLDGAVVRSLEIQHNIRPYEIDIGGRALGITVRTERMIEVRLDLIVAHADWGTNRYAAIRYAVGSRH